MLDDHFEPAFLASLDRAVFAALAACARCLARSGERVDREHVEAVMVSLGGACFPLGRRFADRARSERPELAAAEVIVIEDGAAVWGPRVVLGERIASLERLRAPEVVIAPLREELEARRDERFLPEWHRVWAWPPPVEVAGRTLAHVAMAKVLARAALPRLGSAAALPAIERAADRAIVDAEGWEKREALAASAPSDAGARLALRYLDELGHTDLLSDQDTLLDSTYFAMRGAGLPRGGDVCRVWLEDAFPAGWRASRPGPTGAGGRGW